MWSALISKSFFKNASNSTTHTIDLPQSEFQGRRRQREDAEIMEEARKRALQEAETAKKMACFQARERLAFLLQQWRGPVPMGNDKGEIEY